MVDVEEDLDVVGDEPDRDGDHVSHAVGGQRGEVLAEIGPRPRLGRATRGLVRPRPAIVRQAGPLGHEARGLEALLGVGIPRVEDTLAEGCGR